MNILQSIFLGLSQLFTLILNENTLFFYFIKVEMENSFFNTLMPILADFGSIITWCLICAALYIFGGKKAKKVVILSLIALFLSDVAVHLLKFIVVESGSYLINNINLLLLEEEISPFPSSHVAIPFAAATVIGLKYALKIKGKNFRLIYPLLVFAALIGFSMMYTGAQYPFDVICGAVIGIISAWIILKSEEKIFTGISKITPTNINLSAAKTVQNNKYLKKLDIRYVQIGFILILALCAIGYAHHQYDKSVPIASNLNFNHSDRILIIAPHPDDEALSSAGVIHRAVADGIPVILVVMTMGDGYKEGVAINSRTPHPNPQNFIDYGVKRHFEDINAMKKLGLNQSDIYFLGYPDSGMQYLFDTNWDPNKLYQGLNGVDHVPYSFAYQPNAGYCGENVDNNLESIIKTFKPTIIIYPGPGDNQPDHWATHNFVEYSTAKIGYKGQKLTYVVHNTYMHGHYLTPPKDLLGLDGEWFVYDLSPNEFLLKKDTISKYYSQLAAMGPFLRSFVKQNELFAVYAPIPISQAHGELNLFNGEIPTATFEDVMWDQNLAKSKLIWDHNLIITGLEYNKNSSWIMLEAKNGIKEDNTYKFHFRIFNKNNVKRIDITIQNGKATPEIDAGNSIKINGPIITKIEQDKLIVMIPSCIFNNATSFMYNVDIIQNGNFDRSDWFTFKVIRST